MVKRYVFGEPIETDAVLKKPAAEVWQDGRLLRTEKGFCLKLFEREIVYGLGETMRGINKRGWIYKSHCTDDPNHLETKRSLYGAHNFLMFSAGEGTHRKMGVFFDTPSDVLFDVGYTLQDELSIEIATPDFEVYCIYGDSCDAVVTAFRKLIGRSYIPPRWAFGYGQSRWGYRTSEDVRAVAAGFREKGLPIDAIYLDIDYMDGFKDFTVNRERFPDFEALVEEMKAQNIHLVPIIDAGVKVEEGYEIYEEGRAGGYFCKDAEGEDFIVGVWPGRCCFPDMLNDSAREWFGEKYKNLTDKGIDGFWNDMNEPAIFYSARRLEEAFQKLEEYKSKNLDIQSYFEVSGMMNALSNSEQDYASFYHNYKNQQVCHRDVHNLFGYYMTRSAAEAFERFSPDKRILLFSRASYIGMHRYAGIWQGDNMSWWSHLLLNIKMMPSLNMCGFLYTGADLGGFGGDTTEDLMLRWLAFGIFTPLMRNHSALGTREQEPYRFRNLEAFRNILSARYRLLPYLYSEFMKAALGDGMMFRPLSFSYEDEMSGTVEDQLLIGDEIMVAPVYEQNAAGRTVYFPERMQVIRFAGMEVREDAVYEKGVHYISMALDEVCIMLRENRKLPISEGGCCVEEVDFEKLRVFSFGDSPEAYKYYTDDGMAREYSLEKMRLL